MKSLTVSEVGSDNALQHYVEAHSDAEPALLHELWRATHLFTPHGRMASGHLQGRLLRLLTLMARPKHVLEVGTFSGYSALCMAEALAELTAEDGEEGRMVHTFEINDEMEDFARQWIDRSPWRDFVTLHVADAAQAAGNLGLIFDFLFLDGDKRSYVETLQALLPCMRPGAWLLADNTLWDGHVVETAYDRDAQTLGIRRFNDYVAQHPRLERVILPLRDGLTLIRLKP